MDIKHSLWELINRCPSCAYNNGQRTQQWIYRNRVCIRFSYAHTHIHIAGRQYTREYKISFANRLAATACRHIVRGAFNSARILYTYVYTARKPELMPTPLSPRYTPTYSGIYCAHMHTHTRTYVYIRTECIQYASVLAKTAIMLAAIRFTLPHPYRNPGPGF